MKVIQLPDGTIQVIGHPNQLNEDGKPDGFTEEINVQQIQSEVPQNLIDECERLCVDGVTRFIFDKHLTNTARRKVSSSKKETRDIDLDEYYISNENEFNLMPSRLMPSRFPYYDTETKMTCRWTKHRMVIDWFKKLGFNPGLSNVGPEFEQAFTLSVYDDETGGILYKCILRIQPNLFINLIAEHGDFIENKKTVYKGFFKKSEILRLLNETSPDIYKMIVRDIKLEEIL